MKMLPSALRSRLGRVGASADAVQAMNMSISLFGKTAMWKSLKEKRSESYAVN